MEDEPSAALYVYKEQAFFFLNQTLEQICIPCQSRNSEVTLLSYHNFPSQGQVEDVPSLFQLLSNTRTRETRSELRKD